MGKGSTSTVPPLNAEQRQWVIVKHANWKFMRELCERFERLRLWAKTIAGVAAGTLAWVHWGDDAVRFLAGLWRVISHGS